MNISEIAEQNPNISITATIADLQEWGNNIAQSAIKSTLEKKTEKLLTAKEVEELHSISPATRIRWSKLGILTAIKKGQRIYYPENANQTGKGGSK